MDLEAFAEEFRQTLRQICMQMAGTDPSILEVLGPVLIETFRFRELSTCIAALVNQSARKAKKYIQEESLKGLLANQNLGLQLEEPSLQPYLNSLSKITEFAGNEGLLDHHRRRIASLLEQQLSLLIRLEVLLPSPDRLILYERRLFSEKS